MSKLSPSLAYTWKSSRIGLGGRNWRSVTDFNCMYLVFSLNTLPWSLLQQLELELRTAGHHNSKVSGQKGRHEPTISSKIFAKLLFYSLSWQNKIQCNLIPCRLTLNTWRQTSFNHLSLHITHTDTTLYFQMSFLLI